MFEELETAAEMANMSRRAVASEIQRWQDQLPDEITKSIMKRAGKGERVASVPYQFYKQEMMAYLSPSDEFIKSVQTELVGLGYKVQIQKVRGGEDCFLISW